MKEVARIKMNDRRARVRAPSALLGKSIGQGNRKGQRAPPNTLHGHHQDSIETEFMDVKHSGQHSSLTNKVFGKFSLRKCT